jgi:hypothetical protein
MKIKTKNSEEEDEHRMQLPMNDPVWRKLWDFGYELIKHLSMGKIIGTLMGLRWKKRLE